MNPVCVPCRAGFLYAALATVGASLLPACNCGETPLGTGMPDPATITCTRCHGDPATGNPAPPADLDGRSQPSLVGVGAHQQHLEDGALRKAVGCSECHHVPLTWDEQGHNNGSGRATVTWGPLSTQKGSLSPDWDHDSHTCASVYCHGQTLSGGSLKKPDWIVLDGSQSACGTCHGNPPPAPHPQSTQCSSCHALTVRPDGSIDVEGGHHVDGILDVPSMDCTSCHGTPGRTGTDPHVAAAPPKGTKGETASTAPAVGAHLEHLAGGMIRTGVACTECHAVPTDATHANGKSPKLVFGPLATARGVTPSEDPATRTCASTYCHGATLSGGTNKTPTWTQVDGTQAACGTCHGNPPPAPHPQQTDCATCHPGTVKASGAIDLAGGLHINGVIDVPGLTCTSCHGTEGRTGADPAIAAAPPQGTRGETATTDPAVGAHQKHLTDSTIRKAVACSDCHAVPADSAHSDGKGPKLVFGALAKTGGLSPAEDPTAHTCSSTWCHGAALSGGSLKTPLWTKVDGSQAACGTCHGNPPAAPHPQNPACATCHPATVKADGTIDVAGGKHIDGAVDAPSLTCTSCHGTETRTGVAGADPLQNASPPVDTAGGSDRSARGVGAHQTHVNPGALAVARPFACDQCHTVPTQTDHAIGVVDVTFGPLAQAQGSAPTWTRASNTCASSWCHGAPAKFGAARPSVIWTDTTATDCTSCHGNPPPSPHPQNDACGTCHPAAYAKTGATTGTVDLARHVDGTIDVAGLTCTSCHGTAGRTGADPAIAAAPPQGTRGETATTTRAVGAHLAHLQAGTLADAFACTDCHAVPSSMTHSTGTVDMAFGALSRTGGATPAWSGTTCSSTYCHGQFKNGNAANAPSWTVGATAAACGTCHGSLADPAPGGTHPKVVSTRSCGDCHPGYTRTTVDKAKHVNGIVDVSGMTCTSCHGTGTDSAPPLDTDGNSSTTALGVGAHQGHVHAGSLAGGFACSQCHPDPATMIHANGTVDMTFGALANKGTTTVWSAGAATCASSYCHGGSSALSGGLQKTPKWTQVDGTQKTCTSCHGNPPPPPHVQNDACGTCHTGYSKTGAATGTVTVATHVNGTVEYKALTCTTCHGTTGRTGADPAIAAAPPVSTTGASATSVPAVGAHLAHLQPGSFSSGFACSACHTVPSAMLHADGSSAPVFGTLARTGGATPSYSGGNCASTWCHGQFKNGNSTNLPAWTGGATEAACGTCHGALTDPTPVTGHPAVAPAKSCGDCHDGYTRTTVNLALHVNGVIDGGGEPSTPGSSCGGCHDAIFQGMTGGVAKASKHTLGGGDDPVDPGGAWNTAATLKASPMYADASCVTMCHGDHPHDLTSPATAAHQSNVYLDANARSANRTSATRAATDFASTGTGGLCLSCHTKPVDGSHPAIGQAAFAASAHNYTSNAQGTWQYTLHDGGTFARNCTKCHADPADARPGDPTTPFGAVHFSTNPSLLAGTPRAGSDPANLLCYRCHGNATTGQDLSGKDVAAQLAKTVRHPVNTDAVHDSATEDAAPASTYGNGRYSGANRHANCQDCHSPHETKAGAHAYATAATSTRNAVSGPLTGVTGVQFNYSGLGNFAAPAAGNFSWTATATAEYQICFKCHSSFTFGATPPNGLSANGSAATPVETDVAQEFNPNNASGHPVVTGLSNYANSVAPKALTASDMLAPWNTNLGSQTMMCSDCHNTDAASPAAQGPHGSAISFMTRGTKTGWPTATASAGNFATTMCSDCHVRGPIHSRDGQHQTQCYRCHIVVPHGGKISRLIGDRDGAMPSRYAYNNDKSTLYVRTFSKASRTGYQKSNCSASCSGEHPATAGENW